MTNKVPFVPIPDKAARHIAKTYGYEQVIVIGRKIGTSPENPGGEFVTYYGDTETNKHAVSFIADIIKTRVLGWPAPTAAELLNKKA